jgi:3-dehydroquinate synthase
MNAACFISHRLGLLDSEAKQRCLDGIARAGLPLESPIQLNLVKIKDFLALDKKSVAGTTRWTLLKNIGDAVIDQQVPLAVVDEAIASIQPKADV